MHLPQMGVARLNRMIAEGLAQHLAFAVLNEEMTEADAREQQARNERARKLFKTARAKWPEIDVSWDTSPDNFHRSLDGAKAAEFARDFPDVEVVAVDIEDLHADLMQASQRVKDPVAKEYKAKTAGLVAHLERGGAVTPPACRGRALLRRRQSPLWLGASSRAGDAPDFDPVGGEVDHHGEAGLPVVLAL